MDKNDLHSIPYLGSGLGFRQELMQEIEFEYETIDFIEIIGDHFLDLNKEDKKLLSRLKEDYSIIPHFIGCNFGSAMPVDKNYLSKVKKVIDFIAAPYWSEHIAFTNIHGLQIGHLTPTPYTQEAQEIFKRNINEYRKAIEAPLILENISYLLNPTSDSMTEETFVSELINHTGCGMLLDVTNVYCNSINHNYNPIEYIDRLPLEKVIQLHYVGVEQRNGIIIDSHGQSTQEEIYELMEYVIKRCPNLKGIILERDHNFEDKAAILKEVTRTKTLLEKE